ncbi:hypothetical protein A2311_05320 [candidate division WOR-1 bacterium RIFOXYB2_FULL_48_7]|uniref:Uncharacterized protein n=1 Tax=candidate division WOR-1 bacterium RIFOXYB2_FULL_48_7 TaxID=1802583 RepID=A0A1F4TU56_UNCSA|nr:MAG: hypothetical protein A2311_05320 [candidate division WOR-1 bacterium RIFOXYB2_FULL_48_7]
MDITPACRFKKPQAVSCRHLQILRAAARHAGRVTPNLTMADVPGYLNPASKEIKALFILPQFPDGGCPNSEPLIMFGAPVFSGVNLSFQHVDLARRLALVRRLPGSDEPQLLAGVWGFSLYLNEAPAQAVIRANLFSPQHFFRVVPSSGLTGNMPEYLVPHLLTTLARQTAPEFGVAPFDRGQAGAMIRVYKGEPISCADV